jgi:hypothetical protein
MPDPPPRLESLLEKVPLLKREPHLVTVHFPLVFAMVVPLFHLLYLLRRNQAVERAAFMLLGLGAMATPAATATGYMTWYVNFGARATCPIKIKIGLSAYLSVVMAVLFGWRWSDESLLDGSAPAGRSTSCCRCPWRRWRWPWAGSEASSRGTAEALPTLLTQVIAGDGVRD